MLPAQALFGKKKSASKRHLVGNKKEAWMVSSKPSLTSSATNRDSFPHKAEEALALLISNDNKI
jgi:hypothetical protein